MMRAVAAAGNARCLRWLAGVALAAMLILAGLWPFDLQRTCRTCPNEAVALASGGFAFGDGGLVLDPGAGAELSRRLAGAPGVTIAIRARSDGRFQRGPARIVALSDGASARNFTLGQQGDALDFRLRTPGTGQNGSAPSTAARDAIRPGRIQGFVATYDGAAFRVFADGNLAAERRHAAGSLAGWGRDFALVFGNETTGDRPWRGDLRDVAVYGHALAPDAARALSRDFPDRMPGDPLYHLGSRCPAAAAKFAQAETRVGSCRLPVVYDSPRAWPLLSTARRQIADYLFGVTLWLVPGLFLGALGPRARLAGFIAFAGLALALEVAQQPLYSRTSSLHDLLAAFAGLAAGSALMARRRRA